MYYKLGQASVINWVSIALLQIRAAITNQGNRYYKIGQLLEIGAKCITQIGAVITSQGYQFQFAV